LWRASYADIANYYFGHLFIDSPKLRIGIGAETGGKPRFCVVSVSAESTAASFGFGRIA